MELLDFLRHYGLGVFMGGLVGWTLLNSMSHLQRQERLRRQEEDARVWVAMLNDAYTSTNYTHIAVKRTASATVLPSNRARRWQGQTRPIGWSPVGPGPRFALALRTGR